MKLVLFLCLVSMATADIDFEFCKDSMANSDTSKPQPDLPTNFKMFVEHAEDITNDIDLVEEQYSQAFQTFHYLKLKPKRKSGIFSQEYWVDVSQNTLFYEIQENVVTTNDGFSESDAQGVCQFKSLQSLIGDNVDFDITTKNRKITIGTPSEVLKTSGFNLTYAGKGIMRGGIPTDKWQYCSYEKNDYTTFLATVHMADASLTMPGFKQIPVAVEYYGQKKRPNQPTSEVTKRNDYVNVISLEDDDVNLFVPQPVLGCLSENMSALMPSMPSFFSIRVEIVDLGEPGLESPIVKLSSVKMVYAEPLKMFSSEGLRTTTSDGFGKYFRVLDDYTLGLSFNIDLVYETCHITAIEKRNDRDALTNPDGTVHLKNAKQLFQLDKKYHYVGKVRHATRGMDVDRWITSVGTGGNQSVFVWSFATQEWMTNVMAYTPEAAKRRIPVSFEFTNASDHVMFNMYDFATEIPRMPDASLCFNSEDSMRLKILLRGGSYEVVYQGYAELFKMMFSLEVDINGGISALSRIVNIDVIPNEADTIEVHFELLGKPNAKGDVALPVAYPSVQAILNRLVIRIGRGEFSFDVIDGTTVVGTMNAVYIAQITERLIKPNPTATTAIKPATGPTNKPATNTNNKPATSPTSKPATNPNNKPATNPNNKPATNPNNKPATNPNNKPATNPNNKPATNPTQGKTKKATTSKNTNESAKNSGNSGFSSGAMAGLGIGVFALGLLVGVAAFFLYRRMRPRIRTSSNHDAMGGNGYMELSEKS